MKYDRHAGFSDLALKFLNVSFLRFGAHRSALVVVGSEKGVGVAPAKVSHMFFFYIL